MRLKTEEFISWLLVQENKKGKYFINRQDVKAFGYRVENLAKRKGITLKVEYSDSDIDDCLKKYSKDFIELDSRIRAFMSVGVLYVYMNRIVGDALKICEEVYEKGL